MEPTSAKGEVERTLETRVRPMLRVHGGDVSVVGVVDGIIRLRFEAACAGCPLRPATLAMLIEPELQSIDGVRGIEATGSRVSPQAAARLATAATISRPRG